uniref:Uncharacterized protein n=1 Tax=Eutreptiella gymnastica TaxID=73025 RepID=A0A7S1N5T0_9EUGL|mmetsp:Transcript_125498/g.217622  ORF Transcript_125498/g.217622 Transcript_125498/m.217622 type:complete len:397 (+) Transcript_125498:37-1227(+)
MGEWHPAGKLLCMIWFLGIVAWSMWPHRGQSLRTLQVEASLNSVRTADTDEQGDTAAGKALDVQVPRDELREHLSPRYLTPTSAVVKLKMTAHHTANNASAYPGTGTGDTVPPPPSEGPQLPFEYPRVGPITWASHKVIVPAVFHEFDQQFPEWALNSTPDSGRTLFVYQRTNPNAPRYSYNYGFEAGVYFQFIVDHYDNLPNLTIFCHAKPLPHNPDWLQWVDCLRDDVDYANLSPCFIRRRGMKGWNMMKVGLWVERCWRDFLGVFNLSHLIPPRKEPIVGFYCCAHFAVSRRQLHRWPKSMYIQALKMMGQPPNTCTEGDLRAKELYTATTRRPVFRGPEHPSIGKHTSAGALEHLQHVVFAGQPLQSQQYTQKEWCHQFKAACPRSPCRGSE